MSFGVRAARPVMAIAIVTTYIALHVAITAGLDRQTRDRFHDAPAQAAAFAAALDRYAGGDQPAHAEILERNAWFERNAPLTASRSTIAAATDHAEHGRFPAARERAGRLAAEIRQDQQKLDQDLGTSSTAALWWAVAAGALVMPSLWLRHRRRAAAAEIVEAVRPFVPHQPWWRRPVFLTVSAAGYGLFAAGSIGISTLERGHRLTLGVPAYSMLGSLLALGIQGLLLLGGLLVLWAGFLTLRYSRPRAARGATQALLADGRRPVLYLRSFADDDIAAQVDDAVPLNIHSWEEQLVSALTAFGPVIAVGKPGEPLPRLGAARCYLPRDDWQTEVRRLMDLSQLIVLRLGTGEGLWWEVEQARATQPARKLLLLMPSDPADVAERLDEHLPTPTRLDEGATGDHWTSAVVAFDPDWNPRLFPVKPTPDTRNTLAHRTIRAVKRALGFLVLSVPARSAARAMKAARVSVGDRTPAMVLRVNIGMLVTLGKGLLLIAALALLIRALELAGVG
ncbi:hypothetical protein SAMN05216215_1006102 [Saccharopolyspora shandongensis]|uniref:Transferase n=1 Tax=Saccharopolyspora shandongensis TaxID=418495 RepID=A0A1H2XIU4_9PSEU|nr:transferase [Saccharopolyspora shandongensis]SDW92777.1 hypothetical protein SAMN05216215_1006102 [Saccharopolyspora shandongensis]